MKKQLYIIWIILLGMFTGSCSDFLSESSKDEVRPESVEDLTELMLGSAYPLSKTFTRYLDLMTDDMKSSYTDLESQKGLLDRGRTPFTWQMDMFEDMANQGAYQIDSWDRYYEQIKGCNVVLDMIDGVRGEPGAKDNLRGQALALRAYYYFMLVNLFGQPYNAEGVDISVSPGVPLILESAVKDDFPPRASVAEVYAQMEKDLLIAAPLLDKYGLNNSIYRVTDLFAYTMLSRLYLYMEEWDKSLEYSTKVLDRKSSLLYLHTAYSIYPLPDRKISVYAANSVEIIWSFALRNEMDIFVKGVNGSELGTNKPIAFEVSEELKDLYLKPVGDNHLPDLRRMSYFETYIGPGFTSVPLYGMKTSNATSNEFGKGMRVAESYLNRAECYIHKFMESHDDQYRKAALADLNYLREHRVDLRQGEYVDLDIHDAGELMAFYKEERRRELSFEDHRWFDLRRYGMPEIRHRFSGVQGVTEEFVLEKGSPRYVLPISSLVMGRNPALVPNP